MSYTSSFPEAGHETTLLYGRVLAIVLLSPFLAWMASRAYQPETVIWEGLRLAGDIISPQQAVGIEFISTILIGLYFGLVILFTIDDRKRVQGVLVIIGSLIGIGVLAVEGLLLPNLSLVDPYNWIGLSVGLVASGVLEGRNLKQWLLRSEPQNAEQRTFTVAAVGLFGLLSLIIMSCLIQNVLAGTARPMRDIPVSVATIYLLFGFIKYSSQSKIAVIGPRESGKSLLLLGLYLSFRDKDIAANAEGYMNELISQADEIAPGDDFPIANTYDLEKLSFSVSTGDIFPKQLKISATDHTGELLRKLGENLSDPYSITDRFKIFQSQYRKLNPLKTFNPSGKRNYLLFENQVRTADVVLLLIDVQRVQSNEVGYIDSLRTIGQRAAANGATVMVVATKCDLLIDDFSRVADNPLDQGLEDEFQQTIEQRLKDRSASVVELCETVGAEQIYPVYYETTRDTDQYRPALGDNESLQYQGMDDLGAALIQNLT